MFDVLLYYDFIPAFFYSILLFIIFRILIVPIRYRTGKNFITFTLAGSVGFFVFIPIALYLPYHRSYAFVPLFFFIQAIIGVIGSVYLRVNPFNPKDEIILKMPKIPINNSEGKEKNTTPQSQSIEDSMQIINSEIIKVKQPFYSYREQELQFDGEQYDFPFLLLTPRGVFQIFACNWGGKITFNDSSATRKHSFEEDTRDYSISSTYRSRLLKNILHSIGLEKTPIHTVICTTNPTAKPKIQTSAYYVVTPENLTEFINQDRGTQLKSSELNDLKISIDNSIVKK